VLGVLFEIDGITSAHTEQAGQIRKVHAVYNIFQNSNMIEKKARNHPSVSTCIANDFSTI